MDESFAQPLRSPAVSLVDTDPEALEAAEDMMGEQFSWLAALLNHFADKRGFDAVCKVTEPSSNPQIQKRMNECSRWLGALGRATHQKSFFKRAFLAKRG